MNQSENYSEKIPRIWVFFLHRQQSLHVGYPHFPRRRHFNRFLFLLNIKNVKAIVHKFSSSHFRCTFQQKNNNRRLIANSCWTFFQLHDTNLSSLPFKKLLNKTPKKKKKCEFGARELFATLIVMGARKTWKSDAKCVAIKILCTRWHFNGLLRCIWSSAFACRFQPGEFNCLE